nr:unnamed protein product [Callosobruchus analis]
MIATVVEQIAKSNAEKLLDRAERCVVAPVLRSVMSLPSRRFSKAAPLVSHLEEPHKGCTTKNRIEEPEET